ncbi:hypothetical protein K8I28_13675 [bacterium]|nr:hypothetical protein [bacterium]
MNYQFLDLNAPNINRRLFLGLIVVGLIMLAIGFVFTQERAWANCLIIGYTILGVGLAGLTFIAIHFLTGSIWSVVIRRIPEAMAFTLPIGAFFMLILLFSGSSVYTWSQGFPEGHHVSTFKAFWLNFPFFSVRTILYLLLWVLLGWSMVHQSRKQDKDGNIAPINYLIKFSAIFIIIFSLTFILASFDWLMALEPFWYSTIFGIYNFAGMFESGLAVIILFVVWLQSKGPFRGLVNEEHLHDLGKLLFAFSTFWMYIWFSQYMLIWYSNIPEEAVRYTHRLQGAWTPLFIANIVLNWGIPFFVLLSARTKRTGHVLAKVAVIVLVGRWLDIYLFVMPTNMQSQPSFGIPELGAILFTIGACTLLIHYGLRGAPTLPIKDPYLQESLDHTQ